MSELLISHPDHSVGAEFVRRVLKNGQPHMLSAKALLCLNLHVRLCAEALGQFLVLDCKDRRLVGEIFSAHLRTQLHSFEPSTDTMWVSVCVWHDAMLQLRDLAALRDLLMQFPKLCNDPLAFDLQWWLVSVDGVRKGMFWNSMHVPGTDLSVAEAGPMCLDSSIVFV